MLNSVAAEKEERLEPAEIAIKSFAPLIQKFDFDPTYGFSLEDLRKVELTEESPTDFDSFWRNSHAANEQISLELEFRPSSFETRTQQVREIYFNVLGGYRVGGWICEPRQHSMLRRVEIFGHGYNGREAPDLSADGAEAVQIFMCAPGFHLSACPKRVATNNAAAHVVCGIESRKNYILLASAAAWWSAARVAESLYPYLPLIYRGGSFGGGIGALMLPWERRYEAAELTLPTFGFHTFRLAHRCNGSGESVRQLHQKRPQIRETLRYFDAVFGARRIDIPVAVGVAAFDPNVPPPGQFAVANAIPEECRRLSFFSCGHWDASYPGASLEANRHAAILREIIP